jgi:hypothetical protein
MRNSFSPNQQKSKAVVLLESPRKNNDLLLQGMSLEEMQKYFKYPQPEAAKRLGVSLSTLKRRFYALNMGKRLFSKGFVPCFVTYLRCFFV